ncbi:putative N,N-dimethylaniline monooxygenase COQ6 KNAG_0B00490 [Huiozyma naganishii CBS 8797]|uniref:Ubiquinone biosynthesis monooxygenase COQ6, mitochondrial n=1 Tax=Huiozyma naganishii (strain ATCC MYA-139 / BCRC 22969 / CBS 8797 / KCTC 17520 / NBRC 10181 / NCYC 3082 / Yp74L-3) TaxID=1071383 RepID=J7RG44_HUIN7|nr:hypothetical protein KNAG_0B00490 [Kazachstania naganishii CBS 8797]CCK68498.1 hypothetical protein KNAG_0B00490 [Kazachstania naganishii CBS 8797]
MVQAGGAVCHAAWGSEGEDEDDGRVDRGRGPAGLTLATAIKQNPVLAHYDTTLVDGAPLSETLTRFRRDPPIEYTNRVVSVTPQTLQFLEGTLGVQLDHARMQPYDGVYVSDGVSNVALDLAREEMLYMVEILNVQSSLWAKLAETESSAGANGLHLVDQCKVESIESSSPDGDPTAWPLVKLSNGDSYKTRLLVGADGFNSPVRRFAKLNSRGWAYDTFGLVATLKLDTAHRGPVHKLRGWQRFLKTGPIAHLPLPGDNATLVWSTSGGELSQLLMDMDPELFPHMINAAFVLDQADMDYYFDQLAQAKAQQQEQSTRRGNTTAMLIEDIRARINDKWDNLRDESEIDENFPPQVRAVVPNTRARFPLKLSHADKYVTDRVALVGDAAHTTHPLAGQGLNMGQHDVEQLSRALERATLRGLDIGSLLALEPFWAHSYPFNDERLNLADRVHKIYHTDALPVVAMRSAGLSLISHLDPVKNMILGTLTGGAK